MTLEVSSFPQWGHDNPSIHQSIDKYEHLGLMISALQTSAKDTRAGQNLFFPGQLAVQFILKNVRHYCSNLPEELEETCDRKEKKYPWLDEGLLILTSMC